MDFNGFFKDNKKKIAIVASACGGLILAGSVFSKLNQRAASQEVAKLASSSSRKDSVQNETLHNAPSSLLSKSHTAGETNAMPEAAPSFALPALYKASPELVMSANPDSKLVALTFDAGSDAKAVPLILKTLKERNLKVTFFLTGKFCERFPAECREIADAGMELGNHSYRHQHFTKLSEKQIVEELERSEAAIVKACGRGAKPLFRFPYGDCNARTQRIVAGQGYQPIRWTLDSLDSVGHKKSCEFVEARINGKIKSGFITLMHVSEIGSAEALPKIFEHLDRMGAKIVPVSEILKSKPNMEALPEG